MLVYQFDHGFSRWVNPKYGVVSVMGSVRMTVLVLSMGALAAGAPAWGQQPAADAAGTQGSGAAPSTGVATSDTKALKRDRAMVRVGPGDAGLFTEFPDHARALTLEDGATVPALFYPDQTGDARGALILLSEAGAGAGNALARGLAEAVTAAGWGLVSVGLPSPPPGLTALWSQPGSDGAKAPAASNGTRADSGADKAADTEGKGSGTAGGGQDPAAVMIDVMKAEAPSDAGAGYQARVAQTLKAAGQLAADQGYSTRVLVAVGHGAGPVLAAADGDIQKLVWIAPRFYPAQKAGLMDQLATRSELSMLELAPAGAADEARARGGALKRAGFSGYEWQPVSLPVSLLNLTPGDALALAHRVTGWLR